MIFLNVLYTLIVFWLAIYGLNAFVLIGLYLRNRHRCEPLPSLVEYPSVTVQLPVYNEKYVIRRAIEHLVRLDWPPDRLQIQIVDDSTDETTALARQLVTQYQEQGVDIQLIHRDVRSGFKAGALNAALEQTRGEFIAIFDADFCPRPDFLRQTVPYLVANPTLGFVQGRWGHLNADHSLLTRAQALALDAHHLIEHTARCWAGLANFSGTGGVWRAACIRDCGGWSPKVLTEDVDLGYRAQLRGWKGLMLPAVVSPAELPDGIAALKQQQFRWAKGNVQCLLKLGMPILKAPVSLLAKLQALIHLSYYLAHPLMIWLLLCALPLIWQGETAAFGPMVTTVLSLATAGPPLLYLLAQYELGGDRWRRLRGLPVLILLGTGLALNSTAAVLETLLGIETAFMRTPKVYDPKSMLEYSYRAQPGYLLGGELLLLLYAGLTVAAAVIRQNWPALPFLSLYLAGLAFVIGLQMAAMWQYPKIMPETGR